MPAPLNLIDPIESLPQRSWLAVATVDDENPITFDDELGPLVNVSTKPEDRPLVCRVGMRIAGRGEAEFVPYVAGDELLVAILEGDHRAGGVVICRMCNGIDRFPTSVAGQDPKTNAFAFTRSIAPRLEETNGPILMRQSTTGAFVSIGAEGNVTLRSGAGGALQLSADVLGMQSSDARYLVQLDVTGGRYTVQVGDALMTLASSDADPEKSAVVVPGTFAISTAANPAAEHAISTEAVVNLIVNLVPAILGALAVPPPLPGFYAAIAAGIQAAAATPQNPIVAAAIVAAFQIMNQKPAGVPLLGQTSPGIGSPGTFVG